MCVVGEEEGGVECSHPRPPPWHGAGSLTHVEREVNPFTSRADCEVYSLTVNIVSLASRVDCEVLLDLSRRL